VNANDIRCALRTRYPAGSHALLWEVANATGSNQRRFADAVAVGLWPSHGHEIEGIEIKVSRSDWKREIEHPEKSQPVYRYCNRWWLAAPKGLLEADELPSTWGLLELVGDTLRTKKKAPALTPEVPSIGFVASLLRRHAGVDAEMTEKLLREKTQTVHDEARREIESTLKREREYRFNDIQRATEKLDAIAEATGIDFRRDYRQPAEWIAALKFLTDHQFDSMFTARGLANLRTDCAKLIASIDSIPLPPAEQKAA